MSRAAQVALFLAFFGSASLASAQDALGGGAAFDDEWDAILKLSPPSVAASDAPPKKGRGRAEESGERVRAKDRDAGVEARGSAREQNTERKRDRATSVDNLAGEKNQELAGVSRATKPERRGASDESEGEASRASRESSKRGAKRTADETADKADKAQVPGGAAEGYDGLVRAWHEAWPAHAGDQAVDVLAGAAPVLSLHPVGKVTTPYVLLPNGRDGGFNEAQIAVASQAFGNWPGGPQVSPRLLDLIYHAAQHFNVFHVHLVSGIRNDRSGSRHSHGLAADIVLPGVSDEELAGYFRPQGFLGVGIYTRAGFVHVDVREKSYFWLDKSPPGRRTKIIQVRAEEARLADEAALLRGQNGYVNPPRLQKALHARAKRRMEKARASQ
jgi:hypothetical protein